MFDESMIQAARKTAERAVQDMPDGDLKIKAFEVILNRVLSLPIEEGVSIPRRPVEKSLKQGKASDTGSVPKSTATRIVVLRDEGFFDQPKGLSEIREGLAVRGWLYALTSLSGAVQGLVQKRQLRRTLVQDGKKKNYRYVNP